ncbi:MAG TPA: PIN domain-containing protein [Tepidisphaeraceae bacterium]|nr:PIN domain-containing protein [Tepidisphaeraceae bacterium]
MTPVFLDTVGLIATWDKSDQWNQVATEGYRRIIAERRPVLTTSFVLIECGNAAAREPYRSAVADLRTLLEARGRLIAPSPDDWANAWTAYELGHATKPGIVDPVSFEIMRRLGITDAFTNDRHFKAFGFNTLF